jgi:hypothetical protein
MPSSAASAALWSRDWGLTSTERLLGRRAAQVSLVDRLGHTGVEDPQELLDLAVLRLPARLDPAAPVGQTQRDENRVLLGQQPALLPVVVAVDLDLGLPLAAVDHRLEPLGHPHLVHLAGGLDVPVAERLVQQAVDGLARVLTGRVVGGVRLGVVVRRDLQVAAGLEVDVAELDPLPPRLLPLLAPRGHRPDERLGVEQVPAHAGQDAEEWLGHVLT